MKKPKEPIFYSQISKPTILVRKDRALQNIRKIVAKTSAKGICFRPHFKTHQQKIIGEWFRQEGITAITVSSVDMAFYFAEAGWQDITIAFPCNIREIEHIKQLVNQIKSLNLLVESVEVIDKLAQNLIEPVNMWLKIDVGTHRTGIPWNATEEIINLAKRIKREERLNFRGLLTHAGHTYNVQGQVAVRKIYNETLSRLTAIKSRLQSAGIQSVQISVGDTPAASLVDNLGAIDEFRPGNIVFFDLMQEAIGACREDEISLAVACPVVAKHSDRNELVLYGGAVHLSKESLQVKGIQQFGRVAFPASDGWENSLPETYVAALSQEHGIVRTSTDIFSRVDVGDLLIVLPVHSCLAANLLKNNIFVIETE